MKKVIWVVLWISLLSCFYVGISEGCICSPLDGWHYGGDVTAAGCDKVLGDNGADWSYLYKFFPKNRGKYRISFDFKNELSDVPYVVGSDDLAFLDTFYATIYFVNSCSRFDLEKCSCGYAIPLFDLDANGPFNIHGSIGHSSRGEDWLHFDMVFVNYFHKVIPTFELFDLNSLDNDSKVLIADLSVSQVPIPGTILLLGTGLFGMLALRPKKSRSMPLK